MKSEIIELTIEKEVYEGYGLGFTAESAVFAPFTTKGDVVRGIPRKKGKVFFLDSFDFVEQSPRRIIPQCPHFGHCGGCAYQHLEYEDELAVKKQIIIDSLKRIGRQDLGDALVCSANRFYYRSHATFVGDGTRKGLYAVRSHEIVDLSKNECLLCDAAINEYFRKTNPFRGSLRISTSFDKQVFSDKNGGYVHERCAGIHYFHAVRDFFQSNIFLREGLLSTVIEAAALHENDHVCDLGCGCGFFSIYAARFCKNVIGVDIAEGSIDSARKNAAYNGIMNTTFMKMQMGRLPLDCHTIIADPPRSGMDSRSIGSIISSKAKRLVYVSCNPATLARDIRALVNGGFTLTQCTMIDMFPCTYHIETVNLLVR